MTLSKSTVAFWTVETLCFWQHVQNRRIAFEEDANCITYTNMWYISVKQHLRKAGRSNTPDNTSYQMAKLNFDVVGLKKSLL